MSAVYPSADRTDLLAQVRSMTELVHTTRLRLATQQQVITSQAATIQSLREIINGLRDGLGLPPHV